MFNVYKCNVCKALIPTQHLPQTNTQNDKQQNNKITRKPLNYFYVSALSEQTNIYWRNNETQHILSSILVRQ